jgi:hypothetical protein
MKMVRFVLSDRDELTDKKGSVGWHDADAKLVLQAREAQAGDALFLHSSGHALQVPDISGAASGYDHLLVPLTCHSLFTPSAHQPVQRKLVLQVGIRRSIMTKDAELTQNRSTHRSEGVIFGDWLSDTFVRHLPA